MAINQAPINQVPINAPAAAVVPALQVPLNMAWAINVPPLPVLQVPLNMAWAIPAATNAAFTWSLPLKVTAGFTWDLVIRVGAMATYPLGWSANMAITFPLPLLKKVDAGFTWPVPLLDTDPVDREFEYPYSLRLNREFQLSAGFLDTVNREFQLSAGLLDTVNREFELSAALLAFDRVDREFRYVWSLLENTAINITGAIQLELVKTAEIVPITEGTIEISEDSYSWTGTVNLAQIEDFDKFDYDDDVIVRLYGEEYELVVDGKDRGRTGPAEVRSALRLISRSARSATPRADELTETFGAITASAAVAQILGVAVDWQIIDWLIPAGALAATNADRVELASQIAEAAGGLLETNIDGSFYVRDRYPDAVATWPTATPDQVYLETDAIMSWSEGFRPQAIFNRFRISNGADARAGDRIEFTRDEDTGLAGLLHVFPSPWRDVNVIHTSDPGIVLVDEGDVFLEREDVVEFRDGKGSVGDPVFSIQSVEWFDLDIGPVNFELDSRTVTSSDPVNLYSLAKINYTTRAKQWRTSSPVPDMAQYLVEDC